MDYFLCWLVLGLITAVPFWYFLSRIATTLDAIRQLLDKKQ